MQKVYETHAYRYRVQFSLHFQVSARGVGTAPVLWIRRSSCSILSDPYNWGTWLINREPEFDWRSIRLTYLLCDTIPFPERGGTRTEAFLEDLQEDTPCAHTAIGAHSNSIPAVECDEEDVVSVHQRAQDHFLFPPMRCTSLDASSGNCKIKITPPQPVPWS